MVTAGRVLKNYKGGIIMADDKCSKDADPNLFVVIVGYDKDPNGEEYFLVKNNWGSEWGENGYVKISTSSENVCGILTDGLMY